MLNTSCELMALERESTSLPIVPEVISRPPVLLLMFFRN